MKRDDIVFKLRGIFREVFNDNSIVLIESMTANDVDGWDSITHMLMITKVEETFEIKFKLQELNELDSVGNLIVMIDNKILNN